jgi:hypothetical protein
VCLPVYVLQTEHVELVLTADRSRAYAQGSMDFEEICLTIPCLEMALDHGYEYRK